MYIYIAYEIIAKYIETIQNFKVVQEEKELEEFCSIGKEKIIDRAN